MKEYLVKTKSLSSLNNHSFSLNKQSFLSDKQSFLSDKQSFLLNKRQKIVIVTLLSTLAIIISTQLPLFLYHGYRIFIVLAIVVYLLCLWALKEGMNITKALTLLLLPVTYALALPNFYLFQPLWEIRWQTRIPLAIFFAASFYILLLSQNVFNVASIRTIPLYRAASTVSFVYTILISFLVFYVIHFFKLAFYLNGLLIALISFFLILSLLWTVEMEERISAQLLTYSFTLAVILGELGMVLSFWPLSPYNFMWSVGISSAFFILGGISLDYLRERLTANGLYLFLSYGVLVFLVLYLTTSWSG
ncbi:hypothetical protein HYS91_00045 [Candidatus Daviesbacteria bacterium]|nr:hypothetical protein [Candidatus Daviesbacteria bacterium]